MGAWLASGRLDAASKVEQVGVVVNYFANHRAALFNLVADVRLGNRLRLTHGDKSFEKELRSIRFNEASVEDGTTGTEVGIEVDQPVRKGWDVFRVNS